MERPMRSSVNSQQQMQQTIRDDILARTVAHQAQVRRLSVADANLRALAVPPTPKPLVMLANGDSWFDYPLDGNVISLNNTDIVEQLKHMGVINPLILSVAHHGDATTDEMSLPKQQRMIEALRDPYNWLGSQKPDAILFSGGGNDIAGDQFCIYLDYCTPGSTGLNATRFGGVLSSVRASYQDLFTFRDRYAPGIPIFGHCYDFPIPNGAHPWCIGPWLRPSLDYTGWSDIARGAAIVHGALVQFRAMLVALANNPANNFTLIDTQGSFQTSDWANELHPYPGGFQKLAAKFVTALRAKFPGRI
jgi:hypothetical protein